MHSYSISEIITTNSILNLAFHLLIFKIFDILLYRAYKNKNFKNDQNFNAQS